MGVCVKGMYLPPSCYFCPMTNDGLYLCKANNPYKQLEDDCEERRPNWCPLIEIPEPHGDLIDREELKHVIGSFPLVWEYGQGVTDCWDALTAAQTVIPAEEG